MEAEARAQAAGLLFAGLNSAKELHGLLVLLARYPEMQAEAAAEISRELAPSEAVGYDLVCGRSPRLGYCGRLVDEALRLSPGIEHLRLTAEPSPSP